MTKLVTVSDNICKLKAEKSGNFNHAKICNISAGPLSEGLTHRDNKWKMFHILRYKAFACMNKMCFIFSKFYLKKLLKISLF